MTVSLLQTDQNEEMRVVIPANIGTPKGMVDSWPASVDIQLGSFLWNSKTETLEGQYFICPRLTNVSCFLFSDIGYADNSRSTLLPMQPELQIRITQYPRALSLHDNQCRFKHSPLDTSPARKRFLTQPWIKAMVRLAVLHLLKMKHDGKISAEAMLANGASPCIHGETTEQTRSTS